MGSSPSGPVKEPHECHHVTGSKEEKIADGNGNALGHDVRDLLAVAHAAVLQRGVDVIADACYDEFVSLLGADKVASHMTDDARRSMFRFLLSDQLVSHKSLLLAQPLAAKHCGHHLAPHHFDVLHAAMQTVCERELGSQVWTPSVSKAYEQAFTSMANCLKAAMEDVDPTELKSEAIHVPTTDEPVVRKNSFKRGRVSFSN